MSTLHLKVQHVLTNRPQTKVFSEAGGKTNILTQSRCKLGKDKFFWRANSKKRASANKESLGELAEATIGLISNLAWVTRLSYFA